MMSSAGDSQLSSRSSQVDDPAPSQMSEEMKIETSGGGTSGSVGHAPLVEQQCSAVQMKLTPQDCVKKEETPELNICENENDLNDALACFSVKEEETEDNDYLYCEICKSYFFNKCEIHRPALIIDAPVSKKVDARVQLSSVWLKMSEEMKIETSGGGTSDSVGHAPLVEQQCSAVQMKLTPLCVLEDCVKKEEKPDLNICESENDLNNVPDGSSVKEEETEDSL
ncbi:histone-lysine N-methyltransferase PRDM9-like, partial [Clarias magur]